MKILVADDDHGYRLIAQAVVESQGHDCRIAADGEEAWRLYQEERPDVLITDRVMPVLDGIALCRRIRDLESDGYTYIVLLTTLKDPAEVLSGMRAGADDYLSKPLDPTALQARLLAAERVTMLHTQLARATAELTHQARTDPLTGLLNRSRMRSDLDDLQHHSDRYARSYSVALCDIDHFKCYNDTYGHQAGDSALRTVAQLLLDELRAEDTVYRYGGEEFLVLLPEQTADSAVAALDRVRRRIQARSIEHRGVGPGAVLTLSIGVATSRPERHPSAASLVAEADAALYSAKTGGRNRVVRAPVLDRAGSACDV